MRQLRSILLTGGAGFIGSSLVRHLLLEEGLQQLIVLDKLTYAGNRGHLIGPDQDSRFTFVEGDIADHALISTLLREHDVTGVFNLAAESHVARSLESNEVFVASNVAGTLHLIEACRAMRVPLLQCSTDEVYGSISPPGRFVEISPLNPTTPYAASKAAADLLCLSAVRCHAQDIVITRSSNNYGPRQHVEKLVPNLVNAAFHDQPLELHGDGMHIRDWMHVDDHCRGMISAFQRGQPGAVYLFGGQCERTNLGMARSVLELLGKPASLLTHVPDRAGNDRRYAVDFSKAVAGLDWRPTHRFRTSFPIVVRELTANLRDPGGAPDSETSRFQPPGST